MSNSRVLQAENLNAIRAKTLVIALYSTNPTASDTGTEISGGSYARQSITFSAPVAVADGTYISNSAIVDFPQASGDWSAPASHFGVLDDGGVLQFYGSVQELGVDTTRVIRTGDTFRIAANTIVHKEVD